MDPKSFHLFLTYQGRWKSSYVDLWMYNGPPLPMAALGPPIVSLRPGQPQAQAIIKFLVEEGFFEKAEDISDIYNFPPRIVKGPERPCYLLVVPCGKERLGWNLGWGAEMLERLERFRKVLAGDSAEAMDELLERLERHRLKWYAGAKPPPKVDWSKPGKYSHGPWKYRYSFSCDRLKKPIGKWGYLYYRGQILTSPQINDTLRTPWGLLYDSHVPQTPSGLHGWLAEPSDRVKQPRQALPSPMDAVRFQALDSQRDRLCLRLYVQGFPNEPRKGLILRGEDFPEDRAQPGTPEAKLTTSQARALLRHLAYKGWLGRASSTRTFTGSPGPAYVMYVCTTDKDARGWEEFCNWNLGWGPSLLKQLAVLRAGLGGKAAAALDEVVSDLDGLRKEWNKLPSPPTTLDDARAVLSKLVGGIWGVDKYEPPIGPVLRGWFHSSHALPGTYIVLPGPLDEKGKTRIANYTKKRRGRTFTLGTNAHFVVLASVKRADERTSQAVLQALKLLRAP